MQDANSGIAGYYYWEVVGEGEVPEEEKTYVSGTDKKVTVQSEGERTIAFQAKDNAGNISGITNLTLKIDSTSPKDFSISISEQSKTGFTINAGTTDDTSNAESVSGIDYYEIYINESKVEEIQAEESNPTITYIASNLSENTAYTVYVKAYDKAGNTKESANMIGQTGGSTGGSSGEDNEGINFGDLTEEEIKTMIGKYVDYEPVSGMFEAESEYTGNSDIYYTTNTSLKWRILGVNNNKLILISNTVDNNNTIYLAREEGYNNGVLLLNNVAKALYSNALLGAVGRSVNIEDIEKVSSYDKTSYIGSYKYGVECTAGQDFTNYPNIFKYELASSVNGKYGTKYDLSEQDEYITGYDVASTLKGKFTGYSYTMSTKYMDSIYVTLFKSSDGYVLASRCITAEPYDEDQDLLNFNMFYIDNTTIDNLCIINSQYGWYEYVCNTRPIVEIYLSVVVIGETGSGTASSPFSISIREKYY